LALAAIGGFAPAASADDYRLADPIVQRTRSEPLRPNVVATDYGYRGPRFVVTRGGTSSDEYFCPSGQTVTRWLVVADDATSNHRAVAYETDLVFTEPQFRIYATNWSLVKVNLRLAASCTDDEGAFPYRSPREWGYGDYQGYWDQQFAGGGEPGTAAYAGLIQRAFCWTPPAWPGCASTAEPPKGTKRFALRNGTNSVSLTFSHRTGRRPPAVHLAGAERCRTQRMRLSVHNRLGHLRLALRCRGVKQGATASVRVGKAIVRSFRLRRGSGTSQVHLAKPRGTVEPYMHVSYGARRTPCGSVRPRLRLRPRSLSLRVNARCGRVAGNATGRLYVGGLLTTQTPRDTFRAVCEGHGGGFRTGPLRWLCQFGASISQETVAALAAPCKAAGGTLAVDAGSSGTLVICRV
jgi:hypothetical protein